VAGAYLALFLVLSGPAQGESNLPLQLHSSHWGALLQIPPQCPTQQLATPQASTNRLCLERCFQSSDVHTNHWDLSQTNS
jgi:hypothetical protein